MVKSIIESIRTMMDRLTEVAGNYDLELEVENWQQPEDPDDENWPFYLTLGINYTTYGEHRPASWGYSGGEPEEHPELDEVTVHNAETGEEIQSIPDDVQRQIEDAIWKHYESKKDEYDPY